MTEGDITFRALHTRSMLSSHLASLASVLVKFNRNNEARVNKIGSLPEPSWRRPDHSLHMSQVHEETIIGKA